MQVEINNNSYDNCILETNKILEQTLFNLQDISSYIEHISNTVIKEKQLLDKLKECCDDMNSKEIT